MNLEERITYNKEHEEAYARDDEEIEEIKKEITEYEERMLFDPNFAKEDDELLEHLEEIDPN